MAGDEIRDGQNEGSSANPNPAGMGSGEDFDGSGEPFIDLVELEQHRAERYNHYFAVAMLSSGRIGASDLFRIAASCLRTSDLLGLVDPDGRYHRVARPRERMARAAQLGDAFRDWAVGVILPETDRDGAEIALTRIRGLTTTDNAVTARCAVYPNDCTQPADLVRMVAT